MIHIKLATPMYQGECSGHFMESVLNLFNECHKRNISLSWNFLFNESLIARGRNILVNNLFEGDATHLLFVDSDMKFSPLDIIGMIEADKDVIAAVCPRKEINWTKLKQAIKNNDSEIEKRCGNFNFVPLEINTDITVSKYEPLEVARAGTGVMLIKKQVFDTLKPYVKTFKSQEGKNIFEYFKTEIDDNGLFFGEDYYFCELYKKHGGKIFVAPWTDVGHFGPMLFQGSIF
jgi:hypothetical protein